MPSRLKSRSVATTWANSSLEIFKRRKWKSFQYQRLTRQRYLDGCCGLIHSATGTGKTLAAMLGPIQQWIDNPPSHECFIKRRGAKDAAPLAILWLTPLRALASDSEAAILDIVSTLELPWSVERRTSDVSASVKARQKKALPTVLITTPESISLLLSDKAFASKLAHLQAVIVDEWHELMGTKRGVQTELALARLNRIQPTLQRWGLSATIGNLTQSLSALTGNTSNGCIIEGTAKKKIELASVIPPKIERFPWAGHLGLTMAEEVAKVIDEAQSTLVFTNTRNQTELWYQELLRRRPTLAGQIALHHGSLDSGVRHWVEDGLRAGKLKAVVCTSSLDLGVDFSAVDQVIQIGSPKGAARMIQRAGRSGHSPGQTSRMIFVPTHALELIELAAVRDAYASKQLEDRLPIEKPLDVLAQHLVTIAIGGGFDADSMFAEVRQTYAYQDLSRQEFAWTLDFIVRGGQCLDAYEDFKRVRCIDDYYSATDAKTIRIHRMNIGTITSDASIDVKFLNSAKIGNVEESFVSKLKPGDRFLLAGKLLELVRIADNAAWVRRARGTPTTVPRWQGGRLPLSTQLAVAVRRRLDAANAGEYIGKEMTAVRELLDIQASWSCIPKSNELLIESLKTRDGFHLFFFPFAGRLVHEGLSALVAYRIAKHQRNTFHLAINDYGFLLHSATAPNLEIDEAEVRRWFSLDHLLPDCLASLNASEMGRRQFREIARVAGLVHSGQPGRTKSSRQLQASSNLFFDVFNEYDPENLLLQQTRREVMSRQLEWDRLYSTLETIQQALIVFQRPAQTTPLAFPLVVDRLRQKLSTESLADRVRKMQDQLNQAADRPDTKTKAPRSSKPD